MCNVAVDLYIQLEYDLYMLIKWGHNTTKIVKFDNSRKQHGNEWKQRTNKKPIFFVQAYLNFRQIVQWINIIKMNILQKKV